MSAALHRIMCRCTTCTAWWSVDPVEFGTVRCPCGGELREVDMERHLESVTPAEPEEEVK